MPLNTTNCTGTLSPSDTSWAGLPGCNKLHVPEAALGPAHVHSVEAKQSQLFVLFKADE